MVEKVIDTHAHIWNFRRVMYKWFENDTTILNRNYPTNELSHQLEKVRITNGIFVQPGNDQEGMDMTLNIAEENRWITDVVSCLPLTDPEQTHEMLPVSTETGAINISKDVFIMEPAPKTPFLKIIMEESLEIQAKNDTVYGVVGERGINMAEMKE